MTKILSTTFVLALTLTAILASKKLPVGIQQCRMDDGACIATSSDNVLKNFAQGIAPLGVPALDPLVVPKMEFKAKTFGPARLDQTYYDVVITGVSQIKIKSVTPLIKFPEYKVNLKVSIPFLKLAGNYKGAGTLLGISLDSEGACHIILLDAELEIDLNCVKTCDGFVHLVRVDVNLTAPNIELDFQNLIKGNPRLSKSILDIMKDNNQYIFGLLKDDYEAFLAAVVKQLFSIVLDNVSIANLFIV